MFENKQIKQKIIQALKTDGFNVVEKREMVVATKKENTLYIRGLEDIQTELNLQYLIQQSNLKKIGGVSVSEVKTLITEAINKKSNDIVAFVCDKLNWGIVFNGSFSFNNKDVYFIELETDSREQITMVFLDDTRMDKFFALEMNYRKFLKMVDGLQYRDLKSLAPKFYEIVSSN